MARLGVITSSKVIDAVKQRTKPSKGKTINDELGGRKKLKFSLVCELLTGKTTEHYVSKWMEDGREREPDARALYEYLYGVEIVQVGFVFHPEYPELHAGCSPDGLVGDDGVVEFKCPKDTTHAEYLDANTIPEDYLPQCMWQLACTERQWCDFASFHPDFPKHKKLFVKRMNRDEAIIEGMKLQVRQVQKERDEILARIREQNKEEIVHGESRLYVTEHDLAVSS